MRDLARRGGKQAEQGEIKNIANFDVRTLPHPLCQETLLQRMLASEMLKTEAGPVLLPLPFLGLAPRTKRGTRQLNPLGSWLSLEERIPMATTELP